MAKFNRAAERVKRHKRIRKRVSGTSIRPRLCVCRTLRHLYAQIVDDEGGKTLVFASSLEPALRETCRGSNVASATIVGAAMAERARESGVSAVVFDRGGHGYHGVVKAFADACRKGGLQF